MKEQWEGKQPKESDGALCKGPIQFISLKQVPLNATQGTLPQVQLDSPEEALGVSPLIRKLLEGRKGRKRKMHVPISLPTSKSYANRTLL